GGDTYLFGIGSGYDTIVNRDDDVVGIHADTIALGAGIETTDVILTRLADDLMISIKGTDDLLKIEGYFQQDGASTNVVENLRFANGITWNVATIKANVLAPSLGNDYLASYAENDSLEGG